MGCFATARRHERDHVEPFISKSGSGRSRRTGIARSSASWPTRQERSGLRRRIKEGDSPADVHLVLSGFACRYKLLPSGDRQIMAWLVPGDICDLHVSILGEMDHAIGTLTPCQIAFLPRHVIEELTSGGGTLTRALWWATLVDEAVMREWLVGIGRRPPDRRIAHLFCELHLRLASVVQRAATAPIFGPRSGARGHAGPAQRPRESGCCSSPWMMVFSR
ncbi:Crp/Fnr family transcriptional regulator [Bradyrhizobium canariense]|uniref:Crp/Fnr family transcriptional regulator n=1 Tax=Bradyrhizobium canariense TaxID=255045 RepID=UPI0018E9DEFA